MLIQTLDFTFKFTNSDWKFKGLAFQDLPWFLLFKLNLNGLNMVLPFMVPSDQACQIKWKQMLKSLWDFLLKTSMKHIFSSSSDFEHHLNFILLVMSWTSTSFHLLVKAAPCFPQSWDSSSGNCSLSVVKSWCILCKTEAASCQKYKRIFLGAVSGALSVSLFINPQLFLSSLRKKAHRALAFLSGNILLWP